MSTEITKQERSEHSIHMQGRESAEVRGVCDVISFDEQAVFLETLCGGLAIEGEQLHIRVLNVEQGIVTMDGKIDSIGYFSSERDAKPSKSGFFAKLFR